MNTRTLSFRHRLLITPLSVSNICPAEYPFWTPRILNLRVIPLLSFQLSIFSTPSLSTAVPFGSLADLRLKHAGQTLLGRTLTIHSCSCSCGHSPPIVLALFLQVVSRPTRISMLSALGAAQVTCPGRVVVASKPRLMITTPRRYLGAPESNYLGETHHECFREVVVVFEMLYTE